MKERRLIDVESSEHILFLISPGGFDCSVSGWEDKENKYRGIFTNQRVREWAKKFPERRCRLALYDAKKTVTFAKVKNLRALIE